MMWCGWCLFMFVREVGGGGFMLFFLMLEYVWVVVCLLVWVCVLMGVVVIVLVMLMVYVVDVFVLVVDVLCIVSGELDDCFGFYG